MNTINRRSFLKLAGATAALAAAPAILRAGTLASAGHVVIVGGGFAGATMAKYLRLWSNGQIQVTLIDKSAAHISCILSNLVINGRLGMSNITLSYDTLKYTHGVTVLQDSVIGVDASTSTIATEKNGAIAFDRLVLAPGIAFDTPAYENLPAGKNFYYLVPHAWSAGEKTPVGTGFQYQTNILKSQLQNMPNGGLFVLTIPKAPYRCPPGPYERACVVADYLKRKKPNSKIIVLDANDKIQAEPETFTKAFSQLYSNMLTYVPNASLGNIRFSSDGKKKEVYLANDLTKLFAVADVLNVLPSQRAGQIVQNVNTINEKNLLTLDSTGRWAMVDSTTYASNVPGFGNIHIIGDSCTTPTALINGKTIGKLPKSGHMANSQAKTCADAIVRGMLGEDQTNRLASITANSACYSPITFDQASWLTAGYVYNTDYGVMELADYSSSQRAAGVAFGEAGMWNKDNYEEMFKWSKSLFTDSFG